MDNQEQDNWELKEQQKGWKFVMSPEASTREIVDFINCFIKTARFGYFGTQESFDGLPDGLKKWAQPLPQDTFKINEGEEWKDDG